MPKPLFRTCRVLALSIAVLAPLAVAQTPVCLGGDLSGLSGAEMASCRATAKQVRAAAATLNAPEGWHIVVVCGEAGWAQYSEVSTRTAAELASAVSDSDPTEHTTYIRAARLTPGDVLPVLSREASELRTADPSAEVNQIAQLSEKR